MPLSSAESSNVDRRGELSFCAESSVFFFPLSPAAFSILCVMTLLLIYLLI